MVIGGTSAEYALKVAKYASAKYLDSLPTAGSAGGHAFRDLDMEAEVLALTQQFGIGAQFGGKYFCHDVRVVRLPRHGASCPVAIAVSCSADRQVLAKITPEGVFLEQLERDPAHYLPEITDEHLDDTVVRIDLNQPMDAVRAQLTTLPVKTRVSLTGPLVVARDIAHAKIKEMLDRGEPMPDYLREHAVYYAGPAKTPAGYASGSFGPTTAGRMDAYVDQFQKAGGSMVMLAKGNRSAAVTNACRDNGGFYLGSIGGPAARLAKDNIRSVEVLDFPELGMEAVWRIEVEDFPAFVVVDDKGNDFFAETSKPTITSIPVGPAGLVPVVRAPERPGVAGRAVAVLDVLRADLDLDGRAVHVLRRWSTPWLPTPAMRSAGSRGRSRSGCSPSTSSRSPGPTSPTGTTSARSPSRTCVRCTPRHSACWPLAPRPGAGPHARPSWRHAQPPPGPSAPSSSSSGPWP